MSADPVLVLDDDVPQRVVIQNDLLRYLFADDPGDDWGDPYSTRPIED